MTGAQDSCWSWCCACVRSGQAGLSSALLTPQYSNDHTQNDHTPTNRPLHRYTRPSGGTACRRNRRHATQADRRCLRLDRNRATTIRAFGTDSQVPPTLPFPATAAGTMARRLRFGACLTQNVPSDGPARQAGSSNQTGSAHAAGRQGVRSARNQAVGTSLTRSPNSSDIISARICASRSSCSLRFWARIRSTVMSRFSMFSSNSLTSR